MLKKLVKYDFIWINRHMAIFFAITLIFAIFTRLADGMTGSVMGDIIHGILRGCTIAAFVNTVINCAIRIWVRFRQNFYKDEAYLTHTLPVTKNQLYDSKAISTVGTVLVSFLVVIIGFFIAFWNDDIYQYLQNVFKNSDMTFILVSLFITTVLEAMYTVYVGIFSIVVGHRSNNNRVLISVILGILLYYGLQTILVAIIAIVGIFDDSVKVMFGDATDTTIEFSAYRNIMLIANILYVIVTAGLYFAGRKLFAKGVNVE